MAESLKGTATNTLSEYDRQRKLGIETAKLSTEILKSFGPVASAEGRPSAEQFFAPLMSEIANRPPPTPEVAPPAPQFDLSTALGLLASNLGANLTGREGLAQRAITGRIADRRDVERRNEEERRRFEADKWRAFYETRTQVLNQAFQAAVAGFDSDRALAIQEQHFAAQSALDAIKQSQQHQNALELERLRQAGDIEAARIRAAADDKQRTDTTLKERRLALADMNRVAGTLAGKLKARDTGLGARVGQALTGDIAGALGPQSGLTDEEFEAQARNIVSYFTFGDPEVENAAKRHLVSILNERYGKDDAKKREVAARLLGAQ